MRFVIDETSWRFGGIAPAQCLEHLEVLLDQLDNALDQGHGACYSEDLFTAQVYQSMSFYELYDPDAPLYVPQHIQERVAAIFTRLPKWQELPDPWPASFDVAINGGTVECAPSISWAHEQANQNPRVNVACLVFSGVRTTGLLEVSVNARIAPLWFVDGDQSYRTFFRWLITETTSSPAGMEQLANAAFPSLEFADGAFNSIKNMSKPYRELVDDIVHHLGVLSDHGQRIFRQPWERASAELGSLGVNATDENGKTKANSTARDQRTAKLRGGDTVFWWHTKFELYVDRMHFTPDAVHGGGAIAVGLFCKHFDT
jgi:hypothetical protein